MEAPEFNVGGFSFFLFLIYTPVFTEPKLMMKRCNFFFFFVLEAENIKNWVKIMKLLWHDILSALNDA